MSAKDHPNHTAEAPMIVPIHGKTNWVKNVLAAGEADVHLFSCDVHIVNPRVLPVGTTGEEADRLPRMAKAGLKRTGVFVADIAH